MRSKSDLLINASRPNFDGIQLCIEYVNPNSVSVTRRELKEHSKASIRKLAAGMDRYGFNVPILTDEDRSVVSGCARLLAAKLRGMTSLPIIRVRHLTPEQIELFRIFDNKIAEESRWDVAALAITFDELQLVDPQMDLSDSGFAIGAIDVMRGAARTAELNDLDDAQEPDDAEEPVSRLGDIFECGPHRIICGNSLDAEVIARLAEGVTFSQSLSDPPYDLPSRFFSSNRKFADFQMAAGEMGRQKFTEFLSQYLKAVLPHLADGALIYAFMDYRHIVQLIAAAEGLGLEYKQLLVWVKGSAGMGSFYRSGHELIGVFKHGSAPHRNNIELGAHGRNRSNVLSYPGVMTSGGRKKALAMHPTVKNVALLADLLLDASAPGDAILDSFGGSGSTLIAAEKTGRTAYLCEISPRYVDVAVQRYNALGLGEARLAGTGQTFAELRVERLGEGGSSND